MILIFQYKTYFDASFIVVIFLTHLRTRLKNVDNNTINKLFFLCKNKRAGHMAVCLYFIAQPRVGTSNSKTINI